MYFVPLSQLESVELMIHALRAASGEVDCKQCPVRRVCMKQCLTIADSVQSMVDNGTLPAMDTDPEPEQRAPFHDDPPPELNTKPPKKPTVRKGHLEVVK